MHKTALKTTHWQPHRHVRGTVITLLLLLAFGVVAASIPLGQLLTVRTGIRQLPRGGPVYAMSDTPRPLPHASRAGDEGKLVAACYPQADIAALGNLDRCGYPHECAPTEFTTSAGVAVVRPCDALDTGPVVAVHMARERPQPRPSGCWRSSPAA